MTKTRIITSIFLAVLILLVFIFSHLTWVLIITSSLLSTIAIHELYKATGLYKNKTVYFISLALSVVIQLIHIPNYEIITAILFALAMILFIYLMRGVNRLKQVRPILSLTAAFFVTFFYKSISYLRPMNNGLYLLAITILVSVITDTAAYFFGKKLGKHKLAPKLSPKKTIEGSVGGIISTVILLAFIAFLFDKTGILMINYIELCIYLVLASVIAQFGDLSMSSIKRICSVKDYGTILPGHGGILDRFDSLLFVLPFTYVFCSFISPVI